MIHIPLMWVLEKTVKGREKMAKRKHRRSKHRRNPMGKMSTGTIALIAAAIGLYFFMKKKAVTVVPSVAVTGSSSANQLQNAAVNALAANAGDITSSLTSGLQNILGV